MQQQNEKWIEEVMQSLQGMQRAGANLFLHTRIEAKLQEKLLQKVPLRWALASAIGFLVLLWFNVRVLTAGNRSIHNNSNGVEQVIKEYGLTSTNIYSDNTSN